MMAVRQSAKCPGPNGPETHANLLRAWKQQLLEDGTGLFAMKRERKQRAQKAQKAELYAQVGRPRRARG